MLQPGTIITDLEGFDLGDEGAVVVDVRDDEVELARLDTKEFITVRLDDLDGLGYHAEQPAEPQDPGEWGYDPEAMNSPELHTIRWLPTYWGPRDPNNPSSLTDVMYRPEPYWRRQVHRHYQVDQNDVGHQGPPGDIRMTYKKRPLRRCAARPWGYVLVDDDQHEFYGFGRSCEEAVDDAVEFYRDNPDYRPMDREDLEELSCYPASRGFYEDPHSDDFVIDHGVAMLAHESDSYLEALESEDTYDIPSRFGATNEKRTTVKKRPLRRQATRSWGYVLIDDDEHEFFSRRGDFDPSQIKVTEDEYGTLYIIPGVKFTGDIATDVARMEEDPELDRWLYGELGSDEYITDERGEVIYSGSDVQDFLIPPPPRRSLAANRRTAEPVYWMDPTPRPTETGRHLQSDWGLPRRMRLDRWEEQKDDALDTEALVAHTIDFWQQYRTKQRSYMSQRGDRRSMDLSDWGLMYMHRTGMERNEMDLLYRFMAAVDLIPENEQLQFQDTLDVYYVFRYDRTDQ